MWFWTEENGCWSGNLSLNQSCFQPWNHPQRISFFWRLCKMDSQKREEHKRTRLDICLLNRYPIESGDFWVQSLRETKHESRTTMQRPNVTMWNRNICHGLPKGRAKRSRLRDNWHSLFFICDQHPILLYNITKCTFLPSAQLFNISVRSNYRVTFFAPKYGAFHASYLHKKKINYNFMFQFMYIQIEMLVFCLLQNTCCFSICTYFIEVSGLVIHLRFCTDKRRLRVLENRVLEENIWA